MKNRSILIVDDEVELLTMLKSIFERAGYSQVITATSGEEAMKLCTVKMPDELQKKYSVSDVARFSRWYLQDYPVLTDAMPYGLLVVGYQPDSVFGVSMTKLYYVTDAGFVRAAIAGAVLLMDCA